MSENQKEFRFSKPAIYQIKVQGEISQSWSSRFGGMQITVEQNKGRKPVSLLIGRINDQSALSGILTTLYDMHMTVLLVKIIEEIE
jgi:hypothetical protein